MNTQYLQSTVVSEKFIAKIFKETSQDGDEIFCVTISDHQDRKVTEFTQSEADELNRLLDVAYRHIPAEKPDNPNTDRRTKT